MEMEPVTFLSSSVDSHETLESSEETVSLQLSIGVSRVYLRQVAFLTCEGVERNGKQLLHQKAQLSIEMERESYCFGNGSPAGKSTGSRTSANTPPPHRCW